MNWDDKHKVLTDYMGLPISRTEALLLREQINKHLKKSSADLAAIEIKIVEEKHPYMAKQMTFDPERFQ